MARKNFLSSNGFWCRSIMALALMVGTLAARAEGFSYMDFRANGLMVNNSTGDSFSGELSWHPSYEVAADWKVVGLVGFAPLKGDGETIIMSEFGVAANYAFLPSWSAELGLGSQAWSGNSSVSSSMVNANVFWGFDQPFFGLVDKLFVGVSSVNHEKKTTEIKVGVTFSMASIVSLISGGSDAK